MIKSAMVYAKGTMTFTQQEMNALLRFGHKALKAILGFVGDEEHSTRINN